MAKRELLSEATRAKIEETSRRDWAKTFKDLAGGQGRTAQLARKALAEVSEEGAIGTVTSDMYRRAVELTKTWIRDPSKKTKDVPKPTKKSKVKRFAT